MQAELQALREQVQQSTNQVALPRDSEFQQTFYEADSSPSSAELDRFMTLPQNSQNPYPTDQGRPPGSVASVTDSSWTIGDLVVGHAEVQDCFDA